MFAHRLFLRLAQEMSTVHAELKFAEQKLRREMREELELQLQLEQQRCSDKVAFIRSQVDAHIDQVRKASYAKAHNEIIKERVQHRAHRDATVDAAIMSTKSQHADELHQLNEMQRGYIVRIQELQVENKSLHARNRYLTEAEDGEVRKKELELEREKQRDSAVIAGLEQQVKMLHEQLEHGGIRSASVEATSHRSSIAPPALPDGLEYRSMELKRQPTTLSQTLPRQPPMELKRQSSALSQQLLRQALTESTHARDAPMTLDDLISNRRGSDVASSTLSDGGREPGLGGRRSDAAQEVGSGLTLDQLLGAFELENEGYS
jgi:hypothetical protein